MAATEAYSLTGEQPNRENNSSRDHSQVILGLKTTCIYMGFMCLGMCDSVMGPTFSDMQELLSTDTARLSAVFTAINVGYLCGSVAVGLLFDRFPAEPQLALALGVTAVSISTAPVQHSLVWFIVGMGIEGAGLAYIDAGTQTYCMSAWRGHRFQNAILQGIFMAWSLGSTIGPLLLQPFLSSSTLGNGIRTNSECATAFTNRKLTTNITTTTIPAAYDQTILFSNLTVNNTNTTEISQEMLSVGFGYMAIGFILVPVCLLYMVLYFVVRKYPTRFSDETVAGLTEGFSIKQISLICTFALFFLIYVGMEVTFGGFLSLFMMRGLCYSSRQSALLTSLFWSCTGVGRFVGIPMSVYLKPVQMLIANLTLSTLAFVLLAILVEVHPAVTWCAAAVAGLGVSTVYPCAYLWCSRYIRMTGRVTGTFLFGGSIGSMTLPLLTGILIERVSPWMFTHLMTGASVLLLVICLTLWIYAANFMLEIKDAGKDSSNEKSVPEHSYSDVMERLTPIEEKL